LGAHNFSPTMTGDVTGEMEIDVFGKEGVDKWRINNGF
jgi:hypothetical protein